MFENLSPYGSDAAAIQNIIQAAPSLAEQLHPALRYCAAEVVWATRSEMARTVEDVLARRTRALFLNAQAAFEMAPRAAEIMAQELGHDEAWQAAQVAKFRSLAKTYMIN
jgi:glycerol-3-phosphate dehydrogenase